MRKVYLDNSATSYPKAPGVANAMSEFIDNVGCNVNRGGYDLSYNIALEILETRKLISRLFNIDNPKNVIFTPSVTYSLNMIIKGYFKPGDHIIVTSMEHNAVMRPLQQMLAIGVEFDRVACEKDGSLNPLNILPLIRPNTKGVIMIHASNVCGTILPVDKVAEIGKKYNLKIILDAAQTGGLLDIDANLVDALAFTGHKSLLASPGIGGFVVKDDFADQMIPLITGGTGSASHEEFQPEYLPDKFESGTMNIPAILGLKASLEYINNYGMKNIFDEEMMLTKAFIEGICALPDIRIVGKVSDEDRIAAVSLDFLKRDNAEIAALLDNEYGIMTRCGLHCAPSAHKTLNTYPQGTVRFSFGPFNTSEEVTYALASIKEILKVGG